MNEFKINDIFQYVENTNLGASYPRLINEFKKINMGELSSVEHAVLVKINGVSSDVADIVLRKYKLVELCGEALNAADVADLKRPNGKRIGNVIANRIVDHLH